MKTTGNLRKNYFFVTIVSTKTDIIQNMAIFDYVINKDAAQKENPGKLSSYRQAAELICTCWNNLDVSIIEPYLDKNVTWSGPLPDIIKGKENYLKLLHKAFETLKHSRRNYRADIVFEHDQYYARISIDHQPEDEVNEIEIVNGLITKIRIKPSTEWWDQEFSPSPFGVMSQTSLNEQAAAVAAIEQYVKSEIGDKPIQWATQYGLRNSHCQLSFSCDGISYDVLIEIQSFDERKCRYVMYSEFTNLKESCKENGHVPCILDLNDDLQFESLTLLEDMNVRVQKLREKGINEWTFRGLFKTEAQLSRLIITKEFQIRLPDYNGIEVKMEPIVKAVFILFLRHPEGLMFKELPDYREELTEIYLKLKPNGLTERAKKSIEDVTDPTLNSINEKCARIRSAFIDKFDEHLAKHYFITGGRAEPKKIALPRKLVVWET